MPTFHRSMLRFPSSALLLTLLLGACSDSPVEGDEHPDAVAVEVVDAAGAPVAIYLNGTWRFEPPTVTSLQLEVGETRDIRVLFIDSDGERFEAGQASSANPLLRIDMGDPSVASYLVAGDLGRLTGRVEGQTVAIIQLMHGGHSEFATNPGLPVQVVASP